MRVSEGWQYISNDSTSGINIIKASIEGWKDASGGIGGIIVFGGLILVAASMAYIRGFKASAVAGISMFVTYIVQHYGLLAYKVPLFFTNGSTYQWEASQLLNYVYVLLVIIIAADLFNKWRNS